MPNIENRQQRDEKAVDAILRYWFADIGDGFDIGKQQALWFGSSLEVDRDIDARFGALLRLALLGELDNWCLRADSCLAWILLLDQFTRNIYRGRPEAYAGDAQARAAVRNALQRGFESQLSFMQRTFLYMPLMHSEQLEDQQRCLECFEALLREVPEQGKSVIENNLQFARQHFEIIQQFGRFPYRNDVLGRESTQSELVYLLEGGARFGQ